MAAVPSIDQLRAQAARLGVAATDEDLARVQAFLDGLLPAFAELEGDVPADTVPAGMYLPEEPA